MATKIKGKETFAPRLHSKTPPCHVGQEGWRQGPALFPHALHWGPFPSPILHGLGGEVLPPYLRAGGKTPPPSPAECGPVARPHPFPTPCRPGSKASPTSPMPHRLGSKALSLCLCHATRPCPSPLLYRPVGKASPSSPMHWQQGPALSQHCVGQAARLHPLPLRCAGWAVRPHSFPHITHARISE